MSAPRRDRISLAGILVLALCSAPLSAQAEDGALGERIDSTLALIFSAFPGSRSRTEFLEPAKEGVGASNGVIAIVSFEASLSGGSDPLAVFLPLGRRAPDAEALALAMADLGQRLDAEPAALPVRLVISSAEEEWDAESRPLALGSVLAAERLAIEGYAAVLALDSGEGGAPIVSPGASGAMAPFWLLSSVRAALEAAGLDAAVEANRSLAFRLALNEKATATDAWIAAGIPAIALRGSGAGQAPDPKALADALEAWIRSFGREGPPRRWDRQYLLAEFLGTVLVVREAAIVFLLLAFGGVSALAYALASIAHRERMSPRFARAPTGAANLLALYLALLVAIAAGLALLWLRSLAAGSPSAWELDPGSWAATQLGVEALLFFAFASALARHKVTPAHPGFYWSGATVLIVVDVFVLSAIRLSFAAFLLPSLAAFALTRLSSRAWTGLLSLPLAWAPVALVAMELLKRPELPVYRVLLLPSLPNAAFLAALSLPFLAHLAGVASSLAPGLFSRRAPGWVAASAALALSAGLSLAAAIDARPVGVELGVQRGEGEWTLAISAKRRLSAFELDFGGQRFRHTGGGSSVSFSVPGQAEDLAPPLRLGASVETFLDLSTWTLSASAPGAARLELKLPDADPTLVQYCERPSAFEPGEPGLSILLGSWPPEFVETALTSAAGFRSRYEARATYRLDPGLAAARGRIRVESVSLIDEASLALPAP